MIKLLFPSLSKGTAPLIYELGVAILMVWVGESLHRIQDVRGRYPASYWVWQFIDDYDLEKLIPWYAVLSAVLICVGLLRRACGCSSGVVLRATGLVMAAFLFAFIAIGHLSVAFYSIAGGPYLFLAWRFLELALFYVRKQ